MPTARSIVTIGLGLATLAAAPALADETKRPDKVSFYFAAHEDDWQLFMNPTAFQDVAGGARKTVFIHVTAGDAGEGIGWGGRKKQYYLARENGAEQAMRFMANADDEPGNETAGHMTVNGHSIFRVTYRNTVGYFLRVPDGNPGGTGYFDTGYQSLQRLNEGNIPMLAAVDGSTVYRSWGDLVATVRAIVNYERDGAKLIQINAAELDKRINPGDHSDHLMTAKAAYEAAEPLACVRAVSYIDYASSKLPENLNSEQRDMESSVFAVTLAGVLAFDHGTAWHHYDESYVGKNYFRVIREAADNCGGSATTLAASAKR